MTLVVVYECCAPSELYERQQEKQRRREVAQAASWGSGWAGWQGQGSQKAIKWQETDATATTPYDSSSSSDNKWSNSDGQSSSGWYGFHDGSGKDLANSWTGSSWYGFKDHPGYLPSASRAASASWTASTEVSEAPQVYLGPSEAKRGRTSLKIVVPALEWAPGEWQSPPSEDVAQQAWSEQSWSEAPSVDWDAEMQRPAHMDQKAWLEANDDATDPVDGPESHDQAADQAGPESRDWRTWADPSRPQFRCPPLSSSDDDRDGNVEESSRPSADQTNEDQAADLQEPQRTNCMTIDFKDLKQRVEGLLEAHESWAENEPSEVPQDEEEKWENLDEMEGLEEDNKFIPIPTILPFDANRPNRNETQNVPEHESA